MTAPGHGRADVIDLLLDDHRTVGHLLDSFDRDLGIERREGLFRQLTATLVRHEVAEEVTVYPLLHKLGEAGVAQADARIGEQFEVEALLRSMERLDVVRDAFMRSFDELRATVRCHAHAEEKEAFPFLRGATSTEDRALLADEYERVHRSAPTHPHAPDTRPGSLVVGPVTTVADHARDALRSPDVAR